MRSHAARTGSRWPAATARRQSSPRSPPSSISRTPAYPRGRETTSPSTWESIATTSSAPSTHSSDGRERRVDLGDVNGRVFVNNVSLGVYAEAVQHSGYRDAKLRTLLDTVPDVLGPSGSGLDLSWTGPDGHEHRSGAVILVSNNRYRLGRAVGSGTRPAIDDGLVGIAIAGAATGRGEGGRAPQRPFRQWSAPTFEVRAADPFPQGSTARRCDSSRRCGSRSARSSCESASHLTIPAPRPRRSCPRASPTACARSCESRPGVNRQLDHKRRRPDGHHRG